MEYRYIEARFVLGKKIFLIKIHGGLRWISFVALLVYEVAHPFLESRRSSYENKIDIFMGS